MKIFFFFCKLLLSNRYFKFKQGIIINLVSTQHENKINSKVHLSKNVLKNDILVTESFIRWMKNEERVSFGSNKISFLRYIGIFLYYFSFFIYFKCVRRSYSKSKQNKFLRHIWDIVFSSC